MKPWEYLVTALLLALALIVIVTVIKLTRKPEKAKRGRVHLNKALPVLGVFGTVFFAALAVLSARKGEALWYVFVIFAVACPTLVIAWLNVRITYWDTGFTVRNFWGITRKYTYDRVTGIREERTDTFLYLGDSGFAVDRSAIGAEDFLSFVEFKYSALHEGNSLPVVENTKFDLFHGNVNHAESLLGGYIAVFVLCLGFLVFFVCYTFFMPCTEENTLEHTVIFASCRASSREVVLTAVDGQRYVIRFTHEGFPYEPIGAVCDGKTAVTCYSVAVTPEGEAPYYSLKALVCNGDYLLNFEQTNRLHSREYWPGIAFAGALCLLWVAYGACAVTVGRNPEKYSAAVIRLFFKEGYLRKQ